MKNIILLLVFSVSGMLHTMAQPADTGSADPEPSCQAWFRYYINDSIQPVNGIPYSFNNLSSGNVTSFSWDFGDGSVSSDANPVHFYMNAGDAVTVCLSIATASSCESTYCDSFVVGESKPPAGCETGFTIEVLESYPPVYRFIPDSDDQDISYFWDFGDSVFSWEASPQHQYDFSGNYYVCLKVVTATGCSAYACQLLQATGFNNACKAYWVASSSLIMDPVWPDSTFAPIGNYVAFQDMSKGAVNRWHWDFDDGTSSEEQHPLHHYENPGVYYVCLEIGTVDSCTSAYCDTVFAGIVPYCSLTGTVVDYSGLDGCGLLIELDNGEVLEPAEVVPNFTLKNGQRVRLAYTELEDYASICMVGKIVRIDCIEELSPDHCQASFGHYALPWISSVPPLYQFSDLSTGDVSSRLWDFGDGTVSNEPAPMHRFPSSGYYTVCLTIYAADSCKSTACETAYFEGYNSQQGLCDNFIKLNTEIILNGQVCNGTASAELVDKEGNSVFYAASYYWSTGETGPSISNLCPGVVYSVTIVDSSGCAVSGSFAFGGSVTTPDSLFGFWNYEQDDMTFVFNIPLYSDSIYCEWDFGDGEVDEGASVSHTFDTDEEKLVTVRIYDLDGNLIYSQQIPVTPGMPSGIRPQNNETIGIYPVPATDVLYLNAGTRFPEFVEVEIISSTGQTIGIIKPVMRDGNTLQLDIADLPRGYYIGRLRAGNLKPKVFRFVK
jgi:PKD repeat protein